MLGLVTQGTESPEAGQGTVRNPIRRSQRQEADSPTEPTGEGGRFRSSGVLPPGAGWTYMHLPGSTWTQSACAAVEREGKQHLCLPA